MAEANWSVALAVIIERLSDKCCKSENQIIVTRERIS
jgi:hypothetical protein